MVNHFTEGNVKSVRGAAKTRDDIFSFAWYLVLLRISGSSTKVEHVNVHMSMSTLKWAKKVRNRLDYHK